MTISIDFNKSQTTSGYDCVKNARKGDTFLATDSDGEQWLILKALNGYVSLGSDDNNYSSGFTWNTWEELLEAFVDYRATVHPVDLVVKIDD